MSPTKYIDRPELELLLAISQAKALGSYYVLPASVCTYSMRRDSHNEIHYESRELQSFNRSSVS